MAGRSSAWMRNPLRRPPSPDAPPPAPSDAHRASFPPTHSILPDPMAACDVWDAVPLPGYQRFYPLHNPVGPLYYRNIHLIPPSQILPGARPPSVFSPSFPPISSSDAGPPSASRSTLPTPSSSQTRVADGSKQRPRKTSQGTPDNVDLMDVTDPWGTNWHHTSPYDIGLPATSNADYYDHPRRPRHASMTAAQTGHQTTFKSPLSQSTSAVHELPAIHLPRKLSKRQKPPPKKDTEPILPSHTVEPNPQLPKRMSVGPPLGNPAHLSSHPSLKKEKRGSMFDRFARKLSFIRRSFDGHGKSQQREDDWQHVNAADTRSIVQSPEPMESIIIPNVKDTPERSSVKRIPPPSIDPSSAAPPPRADDSKSSISVEAPFSIGRLTIANPDIPSETPSHIGPTGHSENPPSLPPKTVPLPIAKNDPPPQPRLSHVSSASSDDHTTPRAADVSLKPDTPPVPLVPGRASTHYSTAPSHPHSPQPPHLSMRPLSTLESVISTNTAATAATSSIPFPEPSHDTGLQPDVNHDLDDSRSYLSYADTPLTNISVLANPPTPYTGDGGMSMPATPQVPPPIPIPSSKPTAKSPLSQPSVTVTTSSHSPVSPQLTQESSKSSSKRTLAHDHDQHHSTNSPRIIEREKEREREKKRESRREREREGERRESRAHQDESERRKSHRYTMKSSPESPIGNGVNARPVSNSGHGARRESSLSRHEDQLKREKEEQAKKEKAREREREEQARKERAREKEEQAKREREREEQIRREREEQIRREREEQIKREREREREREERLRREREEQIRREKEREREEQIRREKEREREEQARREKERDERVRREWEEHTRREKEREEQARREREREEQLRRDREKEEQAWREKEELLRKQLEELVRKEEERKEKEEQRRREKEKERERKEREREERRAKEKEKEREERKKRKEERRSKEEKEKKEKKSKEEHKSTGHHRSSEDRKTREEKDRHREHRSSHDKEKEERRRRREKERHSKSERVDSPTEKPNLNKPQPPPPPVESPESSSADVPLTRQPSTSVRPTSELPSAADLNAVRAKEAWEMERLWKARSMYGAEANGAKPSMVPASDTSLTGASIDAQVAMTMGMNLGPGTTNGIHGSSHTSFVVQNSLRPPQPPYAIYSPLSFPSPPTIPSLRESITSYDIPSDVALLNGSGPYRYGGYYGPYGGSSPGLLGPSVAGGGGVDGSGKEYLEKDLPLRSNPLPVPPRESTYEPKPADYWIGYSSLTTSV